MRFLLEEEYIFNEQDRKFKWRELKRFEHQGRTAFG